MLLVAMFQVARAHCDDDGDGYRRPPHLGCLNNGLAFDCNDNAFNGQFVNPGRSEVLGNGKDDECDGLVDMIRHPFRASTFPSLGGDWTYSGGASGGGDSATVPSGGRVSMAGDLDWDHGDFWVNIKVHRPSLGGISTCSVTAVGGATDSETFSTTANWEIESHKLEVGSPAFTVTDLYVECSSGTAEIDWITVGNGSYEWAPGSDLEVLYDDVGLLGGGFATVVVRGDGGTGYWAGSDLGGFAWSGDGVDWETVNGTYDDLIARDQLGVADLLPTASRVWAATGRYDGGALSTLHGALVYTDTDGEAWETLEFGTSTYAASSVLSPCATEGTGQTASARSGGRLIAEWTGGQVVLANHADGGLWFSDTSSTSADQLTLSGFPSDASDIVSALVPLDLDDDGDPDTLVVGFKSRDASDDALYTCTLGSGTLSSTTSYACTAIAGTGWDVRDVEALDADPADPILLVVDGGRRFTDGTSPTCSIEEGTVNGVKLVASVWTPWDLDDPTITGQPGWSGWTTGTQLQNGTGTLRIIGSSVTIGGGELVGLAIDPDTEDRVLAFLDASQDASYSQPRVYYADLAGIAVDSPLDWYPLQDFTKTDGGWVNDFDPFDPDTSLGQRNAAVDGAGTWLEQQQSLATWYPAYAVDGVMTGSEVLVASGFGIFRLPAAGTDPGWDSAYGTDDLDLIPWAMALEPPATLADDDGYVGYQLTVTQDLWVCPDCTLTGADRIGWQALDDLGFATFYGRDEAETAPRFPAEVDCHGDAWSVSGGAVDGVSLGTLDAVVWLGMVDRPNDEDDPWRQGLWRRQTTGDMPIRLTAPTPTGWGRVRA